MKTRAPESSKRNAHARQQPIGYSCEALAIQETKDVIVRDPGAALAQK